MTSSLREAIGSVHQWAVVGVSLLAVALAVGLHYEAQWPQLGHIAVYLSAIAYSTVGYGDLEMARYWNSDN